MTLYCKIIFSFKADTGGPLVINNVQVGVISKQITCGDP